jgi:F-type H+-transporting ATPase subunit epsilon
MDKLLDIEIITPENVFYSGKALSVTIPGVLGPFQVLYNHAPIVSSLELGIIKIVDESEKKHFFATNGGFAEVRKNHVSILVEDASSAESINIEKSLEELSLLSENLKNAKTEEKEELKKNINIIQNKIKAAEFSLEYRT